MGLTTTPYEVTGINTFQKATVDIKIHISTLVGCTIGNIFVMLFSCYGNGKVLATCVQTFKGTRSNFRWLKTNLSVGDFLLSSTQCPILMFMLFGLPVFAEVLLPLTLFCGGLSLTVSTNSISGIAIHRFLKLKCNYELSKKVITMFFVYSWISGVLVGACLATLISIKLDNLQLSLQDTLINEVESYTCAYILMAIFVITLVIVIISYATVATTLRSGPSSPCLVNCPNNNQVTISQKGDSIRRTNIADQKKATLSCIGIICVHCICWLPFVLVYAFDQYIEDANVSFNVKLIAWMFILFQSALNPYIYKVPKDPSKRMLRRFYCEQCLHFPDDTYNNDNKWWLRRKGVGGDKLTRISEVSENEQGAGTFVGIFQIPIPDPDATERHFNDTGTSQAVGAQNETYNQSLFA